MLAIRPPQLSKTGAGIQKNNPKQRKFTPNLLPCRVNYTAKISVAKRYWDPRVQKIARAGEKKGEDEMVEGEGEGEGDGKADGAVKEDGSESKRDSAEEKGKNGVVEKEAEEEEVREELVSYFRGRKFTGRKVRLPEGYRGFVGKVGEAVLPVAKEERRGVEEDEDDREKEVETKIMEELGEFDEIVVWGHEGVSDIGGEGVIRGVEEWIEWAGKIHDCGTMDE
ncbi:hypothetical protein ACMFMG_005408 [Clarireedia jacksonii]